MSCFQPHARAVAAEVLVVSGWQQPCEDLDDLDAFAGSTSCRRAEHIGRWEPGDVAEQLGPGCEAQGAAAGHEEDASTAKLLGGEDDFIHAIFSATRRLAACDITSTSTIVSGCPPADPGGDSLRGMIQWKPATPRFCSPFSLLNALKA